jgi:gamma-glutamylputrescine oxidase
MEQGEPIWESGGWTGLPRLQGEHSATLCVIGLGGSGLNALEEAGRHGIDAIGIDAGLVGGGAAGRNGGLLLAGSAAFYHRSVEVLGRERARAIYQATVEELERMTATLPGVVRRTGSLRIAASQEEEEDCRRQLREMEADGWAASWYEGPEGRGLLIPTDAVFQPLERCRQLAGQVLAAGGKLFEGSPVGEIEAGREGTEVEVRTPEGMIRSQAVLVAVDGRLEQLLPELTGEIRTARLQMLATAPTTEVHFPYPVYRRWGYEYWQQLPDGSLAVGGFRDRGGEAEWTCNAVPSDLIQGALERFLREELRVSAPITHRWAAAVGYTCSGEPISREVRPRVWAIGGYNGTGNLIGAIHGRSVTAEILQAIS